MDMCVDVCTKQRRVRELEMRIGMRMDAYIYCRHRCRRHCVCEHVDRCVSKDVRIDMRPDMHANMCNMLSPPAGICCGNVHEYRRV